MRWELLGFDLRFVAAGGRHGHAPAARGTISVSSSENNGTDWIIVESGQIYRWVSRSATWRRAPLVAITTRTGCVSLSKRKTMSRSQRETAEQLHQLIELEPGADDQPLLLFKRNNHQRIAGTMLYNFSFGGQTIGRFVEPQFNATLRAIYERISSAAGIWAANDWEFRVKGLGDVASVEWQFHSFWQETSRVKVHQSSDDNISTENTWTGERRWAPVSRKDLGSRLNMKWAEPAGNGHRSQRAGGGAPEDEMGYWVVSV